MHVSLDCAPCMAKLTDFDPRLVTERANHLETQLLSLEQDVQAEKEERGAAGRYLLCMLCATRVFELCMCLELIVCAERSVTASSQLWKAALDSAEERIKTLEAVLASKGVLLLHDIFRCPLILQHNTTQHNTIQHNT